MLSSCVVVVYLHNPEAMIWGFKRIGIHMVFIMWLLHADDSSPPCNKSTQPNTVSCYLLCIIYNLWT
jgi:hypothetical protein